MFLFIAFFSFSDAYCVKLLFFKISFHLSFRCVLRQTVFSKSFFIFFFIYLSDAYCVKLLEDSIIPPHALKGHQAVLRCNYDLEGDNLYSVKWYFNQKEFYRYIPSDNPKVTIFNHHHGVRVNVRNSCKHYLQLKFNLSSE